MTQVTLDNPKRNTTQVTWEREYNFGFDGQLILISTMVQNNILRD